jgi:hypothetical protein
MRVSRTCSVSTSLNNCLTTSVHSPPLESYKYAFWTDAGSFRHTHAYRTWPDLARVDAVWERAWQRVRGEGAVPRVAKKEDLIFFPVFEVPEWTPALAAWTLDDGPVDLDISEGELFPHMFHAVN